MFLEVNEKMGEMYGTGKVKKYETACKLVQKDFYEQIKLKKVFF